MLKKLILLSALFSLITASCRDYLTDVVDLTPPEISTDKSGYTDIDTISVTLYNRSYSDLYVTGVYNSVEKQHSANWDIYSIISCNGNCPEFTIPAKGSITERVVSFGTPGTFRFVCYYSKKSGIPHGERSIVYSNEFTVR